MEGLKLGDKLGLNDTDGLVETDGDVDTDGDVLTEGEVEGLNDTEGLVLTLGLVLTDGEVETDGDVDGDTDTDGDVELDVGVNGVAASYRTVISHVAPVETVNPELNRSPIKYIPSGASAAILPINVSDVLDPSYTATTPPFVLSDIPLRVP